MRFLPCLVLFIACGRTAGTCPDRSGSGTVVVQTSGLPAGVAADIAALGNNSSSPVSVTAPTQLDLKNYTLTPGDVAVESGRVRTVYRASAKTICVETEQQHVTIAYDKVPTSNRLWVTSSNSDFNILGFDASTIAQSSTLRAASEGNDPLPGSVAFDRLGNVWSAENDKVRRYFSAQFGINGVSARVADLELSTAELSEAAPGANALAFGSNGDLFVSAKGAGKVVHLAAASMSNSGTVTATSVISKIDSPLDLAFDAQGNLWVSAANGVLRYDASRLTTSTDAPADLIVDALTSGPVIGSFANPSGLAFDADGNLWVSYEAQFVRLDKTFLAAKGTQSLTPDVVLGSDVAMLPGQIAFDELGSLWFAYSMGKLAAFSAAQLSTAGIKLPDVVIQSATMGSAVGTALYPAPSATPLYHRF